MNNQFLFSVTEPIVQTGAGKIRGFKLDGIYNFHGIKYADAKRFQMPKAVEPWDGIKDAISFGYTCPVLEKGGPLNGLKHGWRYWPDDEHCQYLNIWTKTLDDNAKKPVMIWIHGGTFSSGSSLEHPCYDGDNMARHGDLVFVNLNHRLNILGFLDMSSYGSKYENSVNAGIADLVEALKWVKENITAFGGDPDNVTIFGQSGGGRKVTTLMQSPAAAGLFNKAIIQSGTAEWNPVSSAHHSKLISLILKELDIPENQYENLETVPYPVLARAFSRARIAYNEKEGMDFGPTSWTPVKNDWFLGAPPFHEFTDFAKTIPLMMGSVICEVGNYPPIPDRDTLSDKKKHEIIEGIYGENTDKLISLFKKAYPWKSELLLLDFDTYYRHNLLRYAEAKLEKSAAGVPLYLYMFALEFDYEGGKGAWHSSDLPFAFRKAGTVPVNHIEGVMEKLEAEVSGAWISFAHGANPNHSLLPEEWPQYDAEKKAVMVFDRSSRVMCNHEKELVELHKHSSSKQITIRGGPRQPRPAPEKKWVY